MNLKHNKLAQYKSLANAQELDFSSEINDLYNREVRINALESMLCCLVKEDKPIDNCLSALNHLELKSANPGKPKQTIPQMIAEVAYNAFAIIGAFVIIYCLYKGPVTNYSLQGNPSIQQEELSRAN